MLWALTRNRPGIPSDKLDRLRKLVNGAIRDCMISGYEPLVEGLKPRIQPTGTYWQRQSRSAPRSLSLPT